MKKRHSSSFWQKQTFLESKVSSNCDKFWRLCRPEEDARERVHERQHAAQRLHLGQRLTEEAVTFLSEIPEKIFQAWVRRLISRDMLNELLFMFLLCGVHTGNLIL